MFLLKFNDEFISEKLKNESLINLNENNNNLTIIINSDDFSTLYPLILVIPITVLYGIIFLTGLVGNIITCIVIARNRSMHTATNYYLFSLAISDLLLLISGLPPEMYRIWSPETYEFGQFLCIFQGFAAETSANATVLTITAFTIERYFAICHPFLSHTLTKLSRAIRFIIAIWILALFLAVPQAIQFDVEYEFKNGYNYSRCTVVTKFFNHYAFEISTFLFFVGPMTLITVLYILIGIQLRKSTDIGVQNNQNHHIIEAPSRRRYHGNNSSQNKVIKMLIAVVVAFFICWAPFHAQRLLAIYLFNASKEAQQTTITFYMILMHTSGILYFLSTTINPLLYHIMSNKFREAFKKTLPKFFNLHKTKFHSSRRSFQRSISEYQIRNDADLDMSLNDTKGEKRIFSTKSSKIFSMATQPVTRPEVLMRKSHQIFNHRSKCSPTKREGDFRTRTFSMLFLNISSRSLLRKHNNNNPQNQLYA